MMLPFLFIAYILCGLLQAQPKKPLGKTQACRPPDPKDPYSDLNNNTTVNGTTYKCSSAGVWIIDERAQQWKREHAEHIRQLNWAARTRVLSTEEMLEVEQLGISLVIQDMMPYNRVEKEQELNNILLQQAKLVLLERKGRAK